MSKPSGSAKRKSTPRLRKQQAIAEPAFEIPKEFGVQLVIHHAAGVERIKTSEPFPFTVETKINGQPQKKEVDVYTNFGDADLLMAIGDKLTNVRYSLNCSDCAEVGIRIQSVVRPLLRTRPDNCCACKTRAASDLAFFMQLVGKDHHGEKILDFMGFVICKCATIGMSLAESL